MSEYKDRVCPNSGADPAFVASQSSPAVSTEGFNPGEGWPHTRRAFRRLRAAWRDLQVARHIQRRTTRQANSIVIRRNSDGSLWVAGSPQNFAYAMRGLFESSGSSFHFYRVREWQGVLIASRRVFWLPLSGEFRVLFDCPTFQLPPWPEAEECRRIDALAVTETRSAKTENTGLVREDEGAIKLQNQSPTPQHKE